MSRRPLPDNPLVLTVLLEDVRKVLERHESLLHLSRTQNQLFRKAIDNPESCPSLSSMSAHFQQEIVRKLGELGTPVAPLMEYLEWDTGTVTLYYEEQAKVRDLSPDRLSLADQCDAIRKV